MGDEGSVVDTWGDCVSSITLECSYNRLFSIMRFLGIIYTSSGHLSQRLGIVHNSAFIIYPLSVWFIPSGKTKYYLWLQWNICTIRISL